MAYFKYQSTKQINALRQTPAARVWQRNYYEHIIRDQASLDRIRQYIRDNPAQWAFDRENPMAVTPVSGKIRQIQKGRGEHLREHSRRRRRLGLVDFYQDKPGQEA